ncbi:MAG: T9SS type A sorting domain-containing protein [Bacteroidota bacterium]
MKTIFCLVFFIFYLFSFSKAQTNLVPNPSFEIDTNCNWNSIVSAVPWNSPTNGTPDLYNVCGTSINGAVPTNLFGYQFAHTGNGYVGASFYGYVSSFYYSEYLQIKLDTNLIANKRYCASFYLNLANSQKYAIKNIGMYFSNILISQPTTNANLHFTPQIVDPNYETDTLNWVLFSGTFNAIGGERYLIIGNFKDSVHTDTLSVRPNLGDMTYYYIDDLDVHYCPSGEGVAELDNPYYITLYPNPNDGMFQIESGKYKIKRVSVINLLGENIYSKELLGLNNGTINITAPPGVYFVEIETEKGIARKKFVKE